MKKQICAALALALFSDAVVAEEKPTQKITTVDQHIVQQAPANNFSGAAHFSPLPVMPASGNIAPARVTFSPNTITNWHVHPNGQYLIVTEGEGRTQEWGKPIQIIQKGDVVWCPPGVKHWHGASATSGMTHIALSAVATDEQKVTWLEKVELPQDAKIKPEEKTQKNSVTAISLTQKQLSLIPIAAFTATGDIDRLKPALIKGLESDLSVNEIKEAFAHLYAYAGFPRSLNGMLAFKSLLEQRQQQGIQDTQGTTPTRLASDTNFYELGNKTIAHLNKIPLEQSSLPLFDNFSPTIDYALKAHLFGYLFSRDNLGYLERELIVVSTLSALGNVDAQLNSHLRITKNLGVNPSQMQKIISTLEHHVSQDVARTVQRVLEKSQ
ncbi:MAG: cupin domain-containing protein [Gammaproteobacteria bacterium]|nr:MAG: cupin domain-containing protein [Gammaproteobacteria bacterium]